MDANSHSFFGVHLRDCTRSQPVMDTLSVGAKLDWLVQPMRCLVFLVARLFFCQNVGVGVGASVEATVLLNPYLHHPDAKPHAY